MVVGSGGGAGVGAFTYSVARLPVPLVALAALAGFRGSGSHALRGLLLPLGAAAAILGAWALENPGSLFARYGVVGLLANHPTPLAAAARFTTNYLTYLSPQFLLLQGDGNLRQTTGFGGVAARRRADPFLVVFLIEGVAWSLTGREPAVRAAATGSRWLLRPRVVMGLILAATLACAVPYFADYYAAYPARPANAFEAGEGAGILDAWRLACAGGHELFLSAALNQPLIQLEFAAEAPPPQQAFVAEARIEVVTREGQLVGARAGDIGVFRPGDQVPAGSTLLFVARGGSVLDAPIAVSHQDLLRVHRLTQTHPANG